MSIDIAPVRNYVIDTFLFGESNGFHAGTSFRAEGILDSTGVLGLVAHIEATYDLTIQPDELIPDNLDSLELIGAFISRKRVSV